MRDLLNRILPVGRRSVLFGTHQFLWHPLTVYIAWWWLYGWPDWKETVCIFVHDWGYWSMPNMDGQEGGRHPELGANLAGRWFGPEYQELCLYHSRHYAKTAGRQPSKLCWADKFSIGYEPRWFYLLRAVASGEIKEYRQNATRFIPANESHQKWFDWVQKYLILAAEQNYSQII